MSPERYAVMVMHQPMDDIASRTDPLIAERAPWLFSGRPGTGAARAALDRLLGYRATLALGAELSPLPSSEIMARLGALIARDVRATGLHRVPADGPCLIVCNHPTGIADGVVLHHVLSARRPDLYLLANADILRVLPQMADVIAPVEWRREKRSHGKTRETMAWLRRAIDEGRPGIIFPAGRLAKRRGLWLYERPWMSSAAMIARRYDLPVVPVHIRARNSALFYLFDAIHPTLRDITLFYETLNKARQPFRIRVGRPLAGGSLPADPEAGIAELRRAVLRLARHEGPGVSLARATRRPVLAPGRP
ncbi:glycerol acyltransferase [Rhodobacterales bacterium HKCCE3408]|nr:glycerol acyltransferase [Rhodobacterales bacterium HKCCE3408]